ncbi:MAG: ParB/RepB/Spo0J family partition protein [Thermomicrobiales bacterium]|nr:ParB/RepB/Spo0J family partition protein [Thermomicrobiales bacterium]
MAKRAPDAPDDRSAGARSAARRGGLGRGLNALIPTLAESAAPPAALEVEINAIAPNPYQPRAAMDPATLETLADSIRIHGMIQPLVVATGGERGRYLLIAGERRWRAARLAGLTAVPVVVKEAAPRAMLELALVENVVRADLSPLEEAAAYRQLIEEFGLTQAAVAERVGRSRVSITNTLRLLAAPEPVREALARGEITEGHARALLGLPSGADQLAALEIVLARGLTVRQTEELVRGWGASGSQPKPTAAPELDPNARIVQEGFQRALGAKVTLRRSRDGGGAVTIHYGSDEELDALYRRIVGEEDW